MPMVTRLIGWLCKPASNISDAKRRRVISARPRCCWLWCLRCTPPITELTALGPLPDGCTLMPVPSQPPLLKPVSTCSPQHFLTRSALAYRGERVRWFRRRSRRASTFVSSTTTWCRSARMRSPPLIMSTISWRRSFPPAPTTLVSRRRLWSPVSPKTCGAPRSS